VAGFVLSSPEIAKQRVEQGFRFLCYQSDVGYLMNGFRQAAEQSRTW
jgi:2-keto-3-deoxy-L-rhamnonate aldolase RhmA